MTETELTEDECVVLRAFRHAMDEHDWSYVRASYALGGPVSRLGRQVIQNLVRNGAMVLVRGGQDGDGQVIGGTFYGLTAAGRAALARAEAITRAFEGGLVDQPPMALSEP